MDKENMSRIKSRAAPPLRTSILNIARQMDDEDRDVISREADTLLQKYADEIRRIIHLHIH